MNIQRIDRVKIVTTIVEYGANLRATEAGWVCDVPGCTHTQGWAWAWMAQPQRETR